MTKEEVIEILERFVFGAKPCSQREIVDACASAYGMLKKQPSLSSNLDNAAEEYAENILAGGEDMFDAIADGFKAGAEWMAGQGVSMQVTDDTEWSEVDLVVHKNVCEGSIIQIRKK